MTTDQLLCIDPGGTTGWAIFSGVELVEWGTVPDWQGLDEIVPRATRVICETTIVGGKHFNTIGLRVTGVVQYLCQKHDIQYTEQSPSFVNAPVRWGFQVNQTGSPHSADAISHGIIALGPNDVLLPEKFRRKTNKVG